MDTEEVMIWSTPMQGAVTAEALVGIDYQGFAREVTNLRREINATLGVDDLTHLRKIQRWGRICTVLGYGTAWIFPNPISALLISQGIVTRWLLMHHIGHRGYDKVPGVPPRYTSKVFAMGWRRYVDWFDWIVPEAWNYEHNVLHHYNTGERGDPDLVERNLGFLRRSNQPRWRRYLYVALLAATWKVAYYAPSTLLQLQNRRRCREGSETARSASFIALFDPFTRGGKEFWARCLLPYGLGRFVLLPALFLPLGSRAALFVLVNSVLAEIITNVHEFCVIGPNHTGDDLYRFDEPIKDKSEFFARQVLGSVNYTCGRDRLDYPQSWLNYQIEHHLFPDVPMLKYQQYHDRVRELCARYGLYYRKEPIFRRLKKLVSVMIGDSSMLRVGALTHAAAPTAEPAIDQALAG